MKKILCLLFVTLSLYVHASSITIVADGSSIVVTRHITSSGVNETRTIPCGICSVAMSARVLVISQAEASVVTIYDNEAAEAGTTISALNTTIHGLIAACPSGGSGGGGSGLTSVDTSFTVSDFQAEDQTQLLGLINYKIRIIDPESISNTYFYSKIISTGSGYALDPNGTYYRDVTSGNDPADLRNYFTTDYNIGTNTIKSLKNNVWDLNSTPSAIITQFIANDNGVDNFEAIYVGSGVTISVSTDGGTHLFQCVFNTGNNITLQAGAYCQGITVDPNCNAITFPSGTWSGHYTKDNYADKIYGNAGSTASIEFGATNELTLKSNDFSIEGEGGGEKNFAITAGDVRLGYINSASYMLVTENEVNYYAQGEQENMFKISRPSNSVAIGARFTSGDPASFGSALKIDGNAATIGDVDGMANNTKIVVDYKDQIINLNPDVSAGGKIQLDGSDLYTGTVVIGGVTLTYSNGLLVSVAP